MYFEFIVVFLQDLNYSYHIYIYTAALVF